MEDYYEYLDSNGVTTLYKLIKDDTVALIDSYSVTINGITTNLDNHINNTDIHTPITDIENMVDTKISGLVNSAPETLDTLKELSDALGNDPNFATTIANQIGSKANSVHSHVVSDITDFPTIPTKTSQLINDSGYITSVSWTNITDKPNFSTVATSGSYTDLSNTPTIPTKVSQLENDMGFGTGGDTSDCVHKTGNETIGGTKTFTSGPWVTNNHNATGYSIKNTALARNDIPSEYQHYTFRAYDKNNKIMGEYCIEKATTGDALLNMNVRSEDSSGTQIVYGMQFRMTNDGSLARFIPSANNKVHLGDVGAKWASVHVTYTYTNRVITYSIAHPTDNSYFYLSGGTDYNKGATLYLGGVSATNFTPGRFALSARKTDGSSIELAGSPDGTLKWNGKDVALDDNVVHTSGDETIDGNKFFIQDVNVKNSDVDIAVTPSNNLFSWFRFRGKGNVTTASIQYSQRTYGVNDICFYVFDASSNSHGFRIRTDNRLEPIKNNTYSLGSSSSKWANVYATTFNGNLKGNVETSSLLLNSDTFKHVASPSGAHYVHTLPKFDGELLGTTFVKGTNYWYRKHSDGFIEMGGFTNCADGTGSAVATNLPYAFSNTNYTLIVQFTRGTGSGDRWGDDYMLSFTQKKTTTGFVVYSNHLTETGSNGGGYDWYACGY